MNKSEKKCGDGKKSKKTFPAKDKESSPEEAAFT